MGRSWGQAEVGLVAGALALLGCPVLGCGPAPGLEPADPSSEVAPSSEATGPSAGSDIACPPTIPGTGARCSTNEVSPNNEHCYYPDPSGGEVACACSSDRWHCEP